MANKSMPASTGYFNKKMLDILAKENKTAPASKSTTAKSAPKTTAKPKSR